MLLSTAVAAGFAGLVLALVGWFEPVPVGVATAVVAVAMVASVARVLRTRLARVPALDAPAIVAILAVGALTALNVHHSSEHLVTDRDPGVYVTEARWLASEGHLLIDAREGAFAGPEGVRLVYGELGYYDERSDGRLVPQFLHLLPVLLAEAHWLGGDRLLLWAPALLGGVALLAFHAFARVALRGWFATAATVALGANLVQVHFSRDAFTEIPTQLFLFGGLWLVTRWRERPSWGVAAAAGAALGAACLTRLDALFLVAPVFAWTVLQLRLRRTSAAATAALVVVGAALGLTDGVLYSAPYIEDLRSSVLLAATGAVGVVLLGLAMLTRPSPLVRTEAFTWRHRRVVADVLAVLLVVATAAAWFLRPELQTARDDAPNLAVGALQAREGIAGDPRQSYAESTMRWLSWYLGAVPLVAAVVGWAWSVRDSVADRSRRVSSAFLLTFSALTPLYIWQPGISPDQIWAMRRFLPLVLPGLVLFACVLAQRLFDLRVRAPWRAVARLGGAAVVAAVLATPAITTAPVADAHAFDGMLGAVETSCRAMGPAAAVLVLPDQGQERLLPATLRSFCRVPVAGAPPDFTAADVSALAAAWREEGRQLWVVAASRATVDAVRADASGSAVSVESVEAPNDHLLEDRLQHRPDRTVARPFRFVLAPAGQMP